MTIASPNRIMSSNRILPIVKERSARLSRSLSAIELPSLPLLDRYSVTKFLALQEYLGKATLWRTACVVIATPLPALVAALSPAFLPLQPPRDGPTWGFFVHGWLIIFAVSAGNMLAWISVTQISSRIYSPRDALLVGVCCATLQAGGAALLYVYVCFPVPFMFISCFGLWVTNLVLANAIVLRSRLITHRAVLKLALRKYMLCWCVQMTQITIYPTISIIFDRVSEPYQIALTLSFPIIKRVVRFVIKKLARELRDHKGVVSVSSVEICASVYQAMIMQSAPSQIATALVMALDLVQGLFAIKLLMDRPTAVPRRHAISLAQQLAHQLGDVLRVSALTSAPSPQKAGKSGPHRSSLRGSTRDSMRGSLRDSMRGNDHKMSARGSFEEALTAAASVAPSTTQKVVMGHALQLAQTAETLLLVEYFEVVVPLVNAMFLVVASQLHSSQFHPQLRVLHEKAHTCMVALRAIALYSALQTVSFVVMHFVMKYRYGISAAHHLAFVLERHAQSIVGMMVAWLPVIFYFKAVHYGTDFSFKFEFDEW